ncbi:MAG: metallophosphoesterase [Clostridia bacterium]|nr:metallophosphoesterase [Clostridia bacterium]
MSIFAIGDLHLPGGDKKPMDIFGPHWENHFARISEDWRARVDDGDIVLIPGDISWAMQLDAALDDLREIARLPGTILILRGNHDYWWSSLTQLRTNLPAGMHAVQNDAFDGGAAVFCGTRGWSIPQTGTSAQDEKLYKREALRLEMSLRAAQQMAGGRPIIAMMHYPPLLPETLRAGTEFTRLLTAYGVQRCVYGHLHGQSVQRGFCGVYNGVQYDLVSCDALGFRLKEITLRGSGGKD